MSADSPTHTQMYASMGMRYAQIKSLHALKGGGFSDLKIESKTI
ncbi:MAG: hypothetical protein QMC70_05815 [Bacteroidia bacterium]